MHITSSLKFVYNSKNGYILNNYINYTYINIHNRFYLLFKTIYYILNIHVTYFNCKMIHL